MFDFLIDIFSVSGFPARWYCGPAWQREPWWGWIHIISDILIWAAYFAIPVILVSFTRKRDDLPFHKIFYLFSAFILACGMTHLLDAAIFYWPAYRLSGIFKMVTAVVSMATAVSLLDLIPKALQLRSPRQAEEEVQLKTKELRELTQQLAQEIREREQMYEELRDSREMLQLAMAAGEAGFFNWDLSTGIVTFDDAERTLTGLSSVDSTFTADDFLERIEPSYHDAVRTSLQNAMKDGSEYDVRFPFIRPDGKRIWLAGRGCVIRNSNGQPLRFIGINHDVSDQVERERELDETAKLATSASEQKSRFVAQVSHEIRTPLAAMLGCIDSLVPSLPRGETRDTLRVVRSQGEMLRILVNDVLDLSKIEAGRLELEPTRVRTYNIFADICSLMSPLAIEKGLSLTWEPATKLPQTIECDVYRLKQVLVNLIGNAIKFTREGGITIITEIEPVPGGSSAKVNSEFDVSSAEAPAPAIEGNREMELVIKVRDTGVGIEKKKLPLIFDEYEQAGDQHITGTGLGLAICERLVGLMGGRIAVNSSIGNGSTFEVILPIGKVGEQDLVDIDLIRSLEVDSDDAVSMPAAKFPLRVLAAEDTRAIQFVLKRIVGQMVDNLVVVDNGREAIDTVLENPHLFDLVMMDIQMPEVDGIAATKALRKSGYDKPIVALSAGAMEGDRRACMTAGCTHFLAKPIDVQQLRTLLQVIAENNQP